MDHSYLPSVSEDLAEADTSLRPLITPITPKDPFDRNVYCILGLPFDAVDSATTLALIQEAVDNRTRCFLSTPNLNFVIASQQDAKLRDSVIHSDLSIPDGMPIVWVARLLGIPIKERVAGSTLFAKLQSSAKRPVSVYFFGGPEGVAAEASRVINYAKGPMKCVGQECPGFGSVEEMSTQATIERINTSRADFLVVALGAGKGQAWIEHNLVRLNVPVVSHLGAVVNFVAGTVIRSPLWLQRLGLEWIWRIKEEPALISRYVADGWRFLTVLRKQVLPYLGFLLIRKVKTRQNSSNFLDVHFEASTSTFTLRGCCDAANIVGLRRELKKFRETLSDVKINLSKVNYVDSAFLGLLIILRKHQDKNGLTLTLIGLSSRVRRIFVWNGVEFLIENRTNE